MKLITLLSLILLSSVVCVGAEEDYMVKFSSITEYKLVFNWPEPEHWGNKPSYLCDHKWESSQYQIMEIGGMVTSMYTNPPQGNVEVCDTCGLIRIKRAGK